MSAHQRAARREREAARMLGGVRVVRSRFQSAPDVQPIALPSGQTLIVEVKTRKALPRLVVEAIAQAKSYKGDAIAVAVLSETGGEAIVCVSLKDFARLVGVAPPIAPAPAALAGASE